MGGGLQPPPPLTLLALIRFRDGRDTTISTSDLAAAPRAEQDDLPQTDYASNVIINTGNDSTNVDEIPN